jgi:hypothetical protein
MGASATALIKTMFQRIGPPRPRVGMVVLGLMFLPNLAYASDYCTKQQYEIDRTFIESAITAGTIVRVQKGSVTRCWSTKAFGLI